MTQSLSFFRSAPGTPRRGVSVKRIQWGPLDAAWPPKLGLIWELWCGSVAMWWGRNDFLKQKPRASLYVRCWGSSLESDILMIMKVLIRAVNVRSRQQPARVPSGPKDS